MEIEAIYGRQVLTEVMKKMCPVHLPIGKKRTCTEDYQIEYKGNEESVSFLPADREEENTEDDLIEYEDNKESVSFSHRR